MSAEPTLALTCPSAPAEPGSNLLGVVVAPGQVAYVNPSVPVTRELLDDFARRGVAVENRLRFSCICREHACKQWDGEAGAGRCGLVDRAVSALAITQGLDDLPACGIRGTCRWFAQRGRLACAACPEIIRRPVEDGRIGARPRDLAALAPDR